MQPDRGPFLGAAARNATMPREAVPGFEFLMDLRVDVGEVVSMGPSPRGERRFVAILGGAFTGPALSGAVLPGGADWQVVRADGVLELDARYVLRESSGATIAVSSRGLRHGPPEVMARLGRGEDVDPSLYYFRTAMSFETGTPELGWLEGSLAVAVAERKARQVNLKAWRLL